MHGQGAGLLTAGARTADVRGDSSPEVRVLNHPHLTSRLTLCLALCPVLRGQIPTEGLALDVSGGIPLGFVAGLSPQTPPSARSPVPEPRGRVEVFGDPLFSGIAVPGDASLRRDDTVLLDNSPGSDHQRVPIASPGRNRIVHRSSVRRRRSLYVSDTVYFTANEREFETPGLSDSLNRWNAAGGRTAFRRDPLNLRRIGWGVGYHLRPNLLLEAEVGRDRDWLIDGPGFDYGRRAGLFFGFEILVGF